MDAMVALSRTGDQNSMRDREIPRRTITDIQIIRALDSIVYYAVQQQANGDTHHVHMLPFDNLSREQRKAAVDQLLWLAFDVLAQAEPIDSDYQKLWQDVLMEQLTCHENWQEVVMRQLSCRNEQPV